MTGPTPAQAAAHAFITGCVNRGITVSNAAVPAECQLGAVKELWADVAQAANAAQPASEQVRLAREDRDQLRKAVLDLAAAWGDLAVKCDESAALDGLPRAAALEQDTFGRQLSECAAALRKIAGLPS